jgi:hypothetical protein
MYMACRRVIRDMHSRFGRVRVLSGYSSGIDSLCDIPVILHVFRFQFDLCNSLLVQ